MNEGIELLKLLAPVILLEFLLKVFCLVIIRKDKVKYFPKTVWVVIILLVSTLGPLSYLLFGREKY